MEKDYKEDQREDGVITSVTGAILAFLLLLVHLTADRGEWAKKVYQVTGLNLSLIHI